jgi:hypothetical protein
VRRSERQVLARAVGVADDQILIHISSEAGFRDPSSVYSRLGDTPIGYSSKLMGIPFLGQALRARLRRRSRARIDRPRSPI